MMQQIQIRSFLKSTKLSFYFELKFQVTVHQSGISTVVTMRRSNGNNGNTLKVRDAMKMKQGSPSDGSEAYGTGSTTSVVEQVGAERLFKHNI